MKSGAAMLNRETGVRPVLSRSCDAEQILKRHWETGKARRAMKQSQKNCPILTYLLLRKTGLRNHKITLFCLFAQKSVLFFAFGFSWQAKHGQLGEEKLKNKILGVVMMLESRKKALAIAILCTVASVGFVLSADAAEQNGEETMSHNLDEVIVEGTVWKTPKPLAGGNVNTAYGAGILGVQDLNETPFTVVSFTEKTIAAYSDPTQPLTSILANDPSVRSTGTTFYDDFSVRGMNINGYRLYLNGIPGLFAQGTTPVNYLERIDVTSGPAMTTNLATASESAGGLVNMVSKKAKDKPISDITLGFSGRGTYTEQIDVGARFGKNKAWGIRVNALNQDGETAIADEEKQQRNIFINLDHRDKNSNTNLLMGYVNDSVKNSLRWFTFDSKLSYTPSAPDIHKNYGFDAMKWEADKWITTLNHEQKINDNWTAFVNAGYGRYDIYNTSNSDWRYTIREDGTFDDKAVRNPFNYDNRSLQIGVRGLVKTGAVQHELVVAADRFWQKYCNSQSWTFGSIGGNLQDGITSQPDHVPAYPYVSPFLSSESVYKSYKFVDNMKIGKFNVMAGVIKQEADITSYQRNADKTANVGSSNTKSDAVSPLYGIVYKPTDQVSIYASHSESFGKGSVISGSNYLNADQILDPAKTKQNEIGVKYTNGNILASLAYFDVNNENTMDVPAAEAGKFYKTNDGETNYKGIDLSVYGKLADKWNIMGGILYTNVEIEKSTGGKLDGIRKSGIPRWSSVAALEYMPDEAWSLLCRGTYSGSYTIKNEEYKLPSYFTVDLGAKYKTKVNNTPVTLNAMLYNVFDKAYWQPLAGGDNLILSNPRTFMLSATFEL